MTIQTFLCSTIVITVAVGIKSCDSYTSQPLHPKVEVKTVGVLYTDPIY